MSEDIPISTLKDELRSLNAFLETRAYQAFYADFDGEYQQATQEVWATVPQTRGDELQREQMIGAAKYMLEARDWFTSLRADYERRILERETPIQDQPE